MLRDQNAIVEAPASWYNSVPGERSWSLDLQTDTEEAECYLNSRRTYARHGCCHHCRIVFYASW